MMLAGPGGQGELSGWFPRLRLEESLEGGWRLEDGRPSADSHPLETQFLSLVGSKLAGTGLVSGYGSQGSGRHTEVSPSDPGCVLIFM